MAGGKKKSKRDGAKKENRKKEPDRPPSPTDPVPHAAPPMTVAGAPNVISSADVAGTEGSDGDSDSSPAVAKVGMLSTDTARRGRLTEMVPVRFDAQMLSDVRARAADDDRSVSSWIRRAVELELQRDG